MSWDPAFPLGPLASSSFSAGGGQQPWNHNHNNNYGNYDNNNNPWNPSLGYETKELGNATDLAEEEIARMEDLSRRSLRLHGKVGYGFFF